jgi:hypothetical protein
MKTTTPSSFLVWISIGFLSLYVPTVSLAQDSGMPLVLRDAGGSGSSGGSGGGPAAPSRPEDRYPSLSDVEQQRMATPAWHMEADKGEILIRTELSNKSAMLEYFQNQDGNWELRITDARTAGQGEWNDKQSYIGDLGRGDNSLQNISDGNFLTPEGFIASLVNAETAKVRGPYRDIPIPALADFQNFNKEVEAKDAYTLATEMSQDPVLASEVFVKEAVGSVLRPIVNTSAKVTEEIVRKIDCATQGLSISSGCGTPSPWQDYWGTIMTGEGRGYTMTAVVLDAFGMVPILGAVGGAADVSAQAFGRVTESFSTLSGAVKKGAGALENSIPALGFGSEAGGLLIGEGTAAAAGAERAFGLAKTIIDTKNAALPVLGEKYVVPLPDLTGSQATAFEGAIFKGIYEPGEILYQAQRSGQLNPGNWFGPIKPLNADHADDLFNIRIWGNDAQQIKTFIVKERISGYAGKVAGGEGHQFYIPFGVDLRDILIEVKP